MAFQQPVQLFDTPPSESGCAMGDLCQQRESMGPEVEKVLTLLVELGALAVDGGDLGSAMLGQGCCGLSFRASLVLYLKSPSDNSQAVLVKEQGAGDMGRIRRHGVRNSLEDDFGGRPHEYRNAQREVFRKHLDRTKPYQLLLPTSFRNLASGSGPGFGIDFHVPRLELG